MRHLRLLNYDHFLKKPDADYKQFSNFRPISNLKMMLKVAETSHQLDEWLQSAYKLNHSTETVLVRVQNDIHCSLDNEEICISSTFRSLSGFQIVSVSKALLKPCLHPT